MLLPIWHGPQEEMSSRGHGITRVSTGNSVLEMALNKGLTGVRGSVPGAQQEPK